MHLGTEDVVAGELGLGPHRQHQLGRRGDRRDRIENDLARAEAMLVCPVA